MTAKRMLLCSSFKYVLFMLHHLIVRYQLQVNQRYDKEAQEQDVRCRGTFAKTEITERKLVGISGKDLRGIDRPAVRHDKNKVEDLKRIDKAEHEHRHHGRFQQGNGNVEKLLYPVCAVDARCFQYVARNVVQACCKQKHVERDADPAVCNNEAPHGGAAAREPTHRLLDEVHVHQNLIDDAVPFREHELEYESGHCYGKHPADNNKSADELVKMKFFTEEQGKQKTDGKLECQASDRVEQRVEKRLLQKRVRKNALVVVKADELMKIGCNGLRSHVLEADDEVIDCRVANERNHENQGGQNKRIPV